ncbi:MAG: hypothetical protein ACK550_00130 [Synechococcaceae cyanobacterium]
MIDRYFDQSYLGEVMLFFVSFGSNPYYENLAYDVLRQLSLGYPEAYYKVYTSQHLPDSYNDYAKAQPRGYGHWLWKPYLIKTSLDALADNDVCLYVDARSGLLDEHKPVPWLDVFMANQSFDLTTWQMDFVEQHWTTQDIIHAMGVSDNVPIIESGQYSATYHAWRVNQKTRLFVNSWLEFMLAHKELFQDQPNSVNARPNHPSFQCNRYDQSVFSLLLKKSLQAGSITLMSLSNTDAQEGNLLYHRKKHPHSPPSTRQRILFFPKNIAWKAYQALKKPTA